MTNSSFCFVFESLKVGDVATVLNWSGEQFKAKYKRNKPKYTDEIIFHCKLGIRSENAAIAANQLGFSK